MYHLQVFCVSMFLTSAAALSQVRQDLRVSLSVFVRLDLLLVLDSGRRGGLIDVGNYFFERGIVDAYVGYISKPEQMGHESGDGCFCCVNFVAMFGAGRVEEAQSW